MFFKRFVESSRYAGKKMVEDGHNTGRVLGFYKISLASSSEKDLVNNLDNINVAVRRRGQNLMNVKGSDLVEINKHFQDSKIYDFYKEDLADLTVKPRDEDLFINFVIPFILPVNNRETVLNTGMIKTAGVEIDITDNLFNKVSIYAYEWGHGKGVLTVPIIYSKNGTGDDLIFNDVQGSFLQVRVVEGEEDLTGRINIYTMDDDLLLVNMGIGDKSNILINDEITGDKVKVSIENINDTIQILSYKFYIPVRYNVEGNERGPVNHNKPIIKVSSRSDLIRDKF